MGLEVGGKGDTKEKKKEKEKIPHMCHMCESLGQKDVFQIQFYGARISQSLRANGALFHLS